MEEKIHLNFENQLHEQYATNCNSNLSSIISLVIFALAIVGTYGYVFVYSSLEYSSCFFDNFLESDCYGHKFTLDALILITIASIAVLTLLQYICADQGFKQRKEQFVIFALRWKYYRCNPMSLAPRIYPKRYHPFGKRGISIIQGLYGEMVKAFFWLQIILLSFTLIKVLTNISRHYTIPVPNSNGIFDIILLLVTIAILYSLAAIKIQEIKKNYKELCWQYKYYYPIENSKCL